MFGIQQYSTSDVHMRERIAYWKSLCHNSLEGTQLVETEPEYQATMRTWSLQGMVLLNTYAGRSCIRRPTRSCSQDALVLHIQQRGNSQYSSNTTQTQLYPGDMILSSCRAGYSFDLSDDNAMLIMEAPTQELLERIPNARDILNYKIDSSEFGARILFDFFQTLWKQSTNRVNHAGWLPPLQSALYELLEIALFYQDAPSAALHDERPGKIVEKACGFIQQNLSNGSLNIPLVAQEMGVSIRSLQAAFSSQAMTVSGYILEQRLYNAATCLIQFPKKTITQIAFESGFNDSVYCSRCFRKKFSLTPRLWRQRAMNCPGNRGGCLVKVQS